MGITTNPFPHLILRDAWPADYLDKVLAEFPDEGDQRWRRFGNDKELKYQGGENMWGPFTRGLYQALTGDAWIKKLESWFGIEGLVGDAYGGGYHMIPVGGYLGMHVDFNRFTNGLYRRLNCLIYLNHDWYEHKPGYGEDGGMLRLGEQGKPGTFEVSPEFNTTVIFETSDHSWHGHPEPTKTKVRKSFAIYYGVTHMPAAYQEEHSTVWLENK